GLGLALPPTGIIVIFGDLVETELLVIVGADPLRGVDRPLFEGRIDVAPRDLLGDHPELGENRPTETADAEFEAVEIGYGLDLLAKPAAHLRPGVASRNIVDVVVFEEVPQQLQTTAMRHPRIHLTCVHA